MKKMVLNLNLPPDVNDYMQAAAAAQGISVESYLMQLFMQCMKTANEMPYYRVREAKEGFSMMEAARELLIGIVRGLANRRTNDSTLALLDEWDKEAAALTPEERAVAKAEGDALIAGLNQNRAEEGRAPVFP